MQSFSFPFVTLKDVELEQPIFGAIDFGQAMLKAATMASRNYQGDLPPPYTPPTSGWYAAPPPAYSANPAGYGGWVPPTHVFPDQPPADTVYMTDAPPPYPGINGNQGYSSGGAGGWSAPSSSSGMTSAQRKEAEANGSAAQVQNGYYDPNNPHFAYVPPPAYNELPP